MKRFGQLWDYLVFPLIYFLWIVEIGSSENQDSISFQSHGHKHFPSWVLHYPHDLFDHPLTGQLFDVRENNNAITAFKEFCGKFVWTIDGFTDGEVIDALEHFFWGKKNGVALELGALDGTAKSRSMTVEFEALFGWRRVLVEGNPKYRSNLVSQSANAISISAAICEKHQTVHFVDAEYVGGIAEFMSLTFLKDYHGGIYKAGLSTNQTFDLNLVPWQKFPNVHVIDCIPLHSVFSLLNLTHINFFILDVEVSRSRRNFIPLFITGCGIGRRVRSYEIYSLASDSL